MKTRLLIVIAMLGFVLFVVPQSSALSCAVPNFAESYDRHDLLLHGKLVEKELLFSESENQKTTALTFDTIKVYKGDFSKNYTITANLSWDDFYREGEKYVLFADKDENGYLRELCVGDFVSSPSIIKFLDEFLLDSTIGEDVLSLYNVVRGFERDDLDIRINQYSSLNRGEIPVPKKIEWDNAILEPFESNDLVIIGKVVEVNTILTENKTQYSIQVEEYLKGERSFDLITATLENIRPDDFPKGYLDYYNMPFFEKENQVFVYLKQQGGTFELSPYSFTIKKQNVAGPPVVIHPTGPEGHFISQGDEIVIAGIIKKGYLYGLGKSNLDASFNLVVLNEKGEQVEFEKLSIALDGSYEFLFQNRGELRIPGNYSWEITFENGGMGGEFVVVVDQNRWSPLKQIKNGVALIDVKCNEGKVPSYKGDRMRVACVSEETQSELWVRGWATMRLISPGENISHALCNNYEGKWHPEYDGCREVTDLQCSLMGGKFVDNLKICYNEICPENKTYTLCVTNPEIWNDSWSVGNWTAEESPCHGGCGNVASFDDYTIDCNGIDGKKELECFSQAFESCEKASMNYIIYTIEGDPGYLEGYVEGKDECHMKIVFDNTQDKFSHPDDRIITETRCTSIEFTKHTMNISDCEDSFDYQLNYESPDWASDEKCRTIGGEWNYTFHNCVGMSDAEFSCENWDGTLACMSDEQKGHGDDICQFVCEFDVIDTK